MEYRYSHMIDPTSYDNQGLCDGIPLRVHRNSDIDEAGTIRLRSDWQKHVGPLPSTSFGGNLGPIYNFTSVAIPECRPDRLELVSYIMEFGFLHDDLIDISTTIAVQSASQPRKGATQLMDDKLQAGALNDQVMNHLASSFQERGKLYGSRAGEGRLLAGIIEEIKATDFERSKELIHYWKRDLDTKRDRTSFKDFEDFLEYRVVDCGSLFLTALATFGMALNIPPEEKEECVRLTRPVWLAAALTNDVQSWEKECKLVKFQDKEDMVNSVWILMKQHSIDVDDAKERVLQHVKNFVAEYTETVKNIWFRKDVSLDSRKYIEAMQYMISGNLLWGISSPRYHPTQKLTDIQIARLEAQRRDSVTANTPDISPMSFKDTASALPLEIQDTDVALMLELPDLPDTVVRGPSLYLESLQSKNVRGQTAEAFNIWLKIPEKDMTRILDVITLLHGASLLLDDVQDGSVLRRGKPCAHKVYGVSQTINCTGHQIMEALCKVQELGDAQSLSIFQEEVSSLYVGQSYDLHWTSNIECPSLAAFFTMVDKKTGGLFRMLSRLMLAKCQLSSKPGILRLVTLLGRFFQVRDDYMNLSSNEYAEQKGFCEDLDEGKFSLAVIHALQTGSEHRRTLLRGLLSQRHAQGMLSLAQKKLFLEQLQQCGSLEYTIDTARKLQAELKAEVQLIEETTGVQNEALSHLLNALKV